MLCVLVALAGGAIPNQRPVAYLSPPRHLPPVGGAAPRNEDANPAAALGLAAAQAPPPPPLTPPSQEELALARAIGEPAARMSMPLVRPASGTRLHDIEERVHAVERVAVNMPEYNARQRGLERRLAAVEGLQAAGGTAADKELREMEGRLAAALSALSRAEDERVGLRRRVEAAERAAGESAAAAKRLEGSVDHEAQSWLAELRARDDLHGQFRDQQRVNVSRLVEEMTGMEKQIVALRDINARQLESAGLERRRMEAKLEAHGQYLDKLRDAESETVTTAAEQFAIIRSRQAEMENGIKFWTDKLAEERSGRETADEAVARAMQRMDEGVRSWEQQMEKRTQAMVEQRAAELARALRAAEDGALERDAVQAAQMEQNVDHISKKSLVDRRSQAERMLLVERALREEHNKRVLAEGALRKAQEKMAQEARAILKDERRTREAREKRLREQITAALGKLRTFARDMEESQERSHRGLEQVVKMEIAARVGQAEKMRKIIGEAATSGRAEQKATVAALGVRMEALDSRVSVAVAAQRKLYTRHATFESEVEDAVGAVFGGMRDMEGDVIDMMLDHEVTRIEMEDIDASTGDAISAGLQALGEDMFAGLGELHSETQLTFAELAGTLQSLNDERMMEDSLRARMHDDIETLGVQLVGVHDEMAVAADNLDTTKDEFASVIAGLEEGLRGEARAREAADATLDVVLRGVVGDAAKQAEAKRGELRAEHGALLESLRADADADAAELKVAREESAAEFECVRKDLRAAVRRGDKGRGFLASEIADTRAVAALATERLAEHVDAMQGDLREALESEAAQRAESDRELAAWLQDEGEVREAAAEALRGELHEAVEGATDGVDALVIDALLDGELHSLEAEFAAERASENAAADLKAERGAREAADLALRVEVTAARAGAASAHAALGRDLEAAKDELRQRLSDESDALAEAAAAVDERTAKVLGAARGELSAAMEASHSTLKEAIESSIADGVLAEEALRVELAAEMDAAVGAECGARCAAVQALSADAAALGEALRKEGAARGDALVAASEAWRTEAMRLNDEVAIERAERVAGDEALRTKVAETAQGEDDALAAAVGKARAAARDEAEAIRADIERLEADAALAEEAMRAEYTFSLDAVDVRFDDQGAAQHAFEERMASDLTDGLGRVKEKVDAGVAERLDKYRRSAEAMRAGLILQIEREGAGAAVARTRIESTLRERVADEAKRAAAGRAELGARLHGEIAELSAKLNSKDGDKGEAIAELHVRIDEEGAARKRGEAGLEEGARALAAEVEDAMAQNLADGLLEAEMAHAELYSEVASAREEARSGLVASHKALAASVVSTHKALADSMQVNHANLAGALEGKVTELEAGIGSVVAALESEVDARKTGDVAAAANVASIVGDLTAAIEEAEGRGEAAADSVSGRLNELDARLSAKVDDSLADVQRALVEHEGAAADARQAHERQVDACVVRLEESVVPAAAAAGEARVAALRADWEASVADVALDVEAVRAELTGGIDGVEAAIATEAAERKAAITSLSEMGLGDAAAISSSLEAQITAVKSEAADALAAEATERKSSVAAVKGSVVEAREDLRAMVDAERVAREAADGANAKATTDAVRALGDDLEREVADLTLEFEAARAESTGETGRVEAALEREVAARMADAATMRSECASAVSAAKAQVEAGVAAAAAALAESIESEVGARAEGDAALRDALAAEGKERAAGEAALRDGLEVAAADFVTQIETARAEAGGAADALGAALDAERTERLAHERAAGTGHGDRISALESALTERLDTIETYAKEGLETEAAERKRADDSGAAAAMGEIARLDMQLEELAEASSASREGMAASAMERAQADTSAAMVRIDEVESVLRASLAAESEARANGDADVAGETAAKLEAAFKMAERDVADLKSLHDLAEADARSSEEALRAELGEEIRQVGVASSRSLADARRYADERMAEARADAAKGIAGISEAAASVSGLQAAIDKMGDVLDAERSERAAGIEGLRAEVGALVADAASKEGEAREAAMAALAETLAQLTGSLESGQEARTTGETTLRTEMKSLAEDIMRTVEESTDEQHATNAALEQAIKDAEDRATSAATERVDGAGGVMERLEEAKEAALGAAAAAREECDQQVAAAREAANASVAELKEETLADLAAAANEALAAREELKEDLVGEVEATKDKLETTRVEIVEQLEALKAETLEASVSAGAENLELAVATLEGAISELDGRVAVEEKARGADVQTLEARMDAVADKASDAVERAAENLSTQLEAARGELDARVTRININAHTLADEVAKGASEALADGVLTMDAKLADLTDCNAANENRLADLDSRQAELSGRVEQGESVASAVQETMVTLTDKLEASQDTLGDGVAKAVGRLDLLEAALEEEKARVGDTVGRIESGARDAAARAAALAGRVEGVSTTLEELKRKVEVEMAPKLEVIEAGMAAASAAEGAIASVRARADEMAKKVEAESASHLEVRAKMANAEGLLEKLQAELAPLKLEVAPLKAEMALLRSNVQGMPTTDAVKSAVASETSQLTEALKGLKADLAESGKGAGKGGEEVRQELGAIKAALAEMTKSFAEARRPPSATRRPPSGPPTDGSN